MILEVIMEMIIPHMMASIIYDGVEKGDLHHIYVVGSVHGGSSSHRSVCRYHGGGKYGSKSVCRICKKKSASGYV